MVDLRRPARRRGLEVEDVTLHRRPSCRVIDGADLRGRCHALVRRVTSAIDVTARVSGSAVWSQAAAHAATTQRGAIANTGPNPAQLDPRWRGFRRARSRSAAVLCASRLADGSPVRTTVSLSRGCEGLAETWRRTLRGSACYNPLRERGRGIKTGRRLGTPPRSRALPECCGRVGRAIPPLVAAVPGFAAL